MLISIVVPAYNEAGEIGKLLASLQSLTTQHALEVIVVDNASTDGTARVAEQWQGRLPLRVLAEPRKGRGAARAAGFAAARGEIIFSTDADAAVPPDWIERMLAHFTSERVVAVSGTCKITDRAAPINLAFNLIQPAAMVLHRLAFGNFWLTGSNFAIRRAAYQRSGGFNLALNSQEDTQLSFQVRQLGKIAFALRPAVVASGRRFKRSFLLGLWDYIRSFFERFLLGKPNVHLSDER